MSNNIKGALFLASTIFFISGCDTTTVGEGVVQGASGRAIDRVSFQVEESFGDEQASVIATFASGERYKGKFIVAKSNTSANTNYWDLSDDDSFGDDLFTTSSSTTYHSKATGVLFGPSGKTMECSMTLATPSVGFSGGAVGKCKLSTGQRVPMQLHES